MPFQGPYNIDWIYSSNSTAHVANHRDWFLNSTPFASKIYSPFGSGIEVLGIGDVQLEVNMKQHMDVGGAFHSLVLRDVLYAPEATTNVVAGRDLGEFSTCSLGYDGEIYNPKTGATLLLDGTRLYKLWLVGQPWGQTSLRSDRAYLITVHWPDTERARWESYKRVEGETAVVTDEHAHKRTHSAITNGTAPVSHSGASNGGGNARGRKKRNKGKGHPQILATDDSQPRNTAAQTVQAEPTFQARGGPQASSPARRRPRYSSADKAWLKANYGNEFKFLRAYGLKIFKEDDRQEGERIVRSMMD